MTYLLFQWSHWDYKYLQRALGPDCRVLFSKDYKQRVVRQWRDAIRYYLSHEEERRERATGFHVFLKEECHEKVFGDIVKKMVMSLREEYKEGSEQTQ